MSDLCFIDTETTGLDPRIHQPYEVAWAKGEGLVQSLTLPHDLQNADMQALAIGRYFDRDFHRKQSPTGVAQFLAGELRGVTLVGSNPAFDASMLTRVIGTAVWHYRLINVAEGAMWTFGWDRPKGLVDVVAKCRDLGYVVPEPNHTAAGDVRATRSVYNALRAIRKAAR